MPEKARKIINDRQDLEKARLMQQMLLPKAHLLERMHRHFGLQVTSHFEPCGMTGGDFWGVDALCCDHIGFYIVDCSGHGFSAALNTFRIHALIENLGDIYLKLHPQHFLSFLNEKLCQLLSPEQFATMFYGVVNTVKHEMVYATAAAPAPILISPKGKVKMLQGKGFPLGVVKDAHFETHKVKFNKGDRLVLYSDALTESFNKRGEMFGEEGLLELLNEGGKIECQPIIDRVMARQKTYRHGGLRDDLTVNVYCRC